ncbi:MAG: zinc-ribbon domain-containing protein [Ruminobacter sp.]|uniref:zinc-ribbon domain-containing protein n=1 Tax=Ruminobacter sp. TaxID=2774296 RepID=UPI001B3E4E9D|nr:zinc-ribbon domain-containing protein [Ruminobacter sp.]MBP3749486.1 zinc-ribbon domain-containing protein [Ruminobacter sp.]
MRCQVCNAELDDDVVFCEKCGARISKDNSIASKLHFSKNKPAADNQNSSGGFYSSTNKGKSTDANNSVVFDAKIKDEDVAHIVIDKSEIPEKKPESASDNESVIAAATAAPSSSSPVSSVKDDVSEGSIDLTDSGSGEFDLSAGGELDLSSEGEIDLSVSSSTDDSLDFSSSASTDDSLDFSSSASTDDSLDLSVNASADDSLDLTEETKPAVSQPQPKPVSQSGAAPASGIAAMIQKAMDNAGDTSSQESEPASAEVVDLAGENVSEPVSAASEAKETAPSEPAATAVAPAESEQDQTSEYDDADEAEISGTFEYNAGVADKKIISFAAAAFGAIACLLLCVLVEDAARFLLCVLGAAAFGYAFYITSQVHRSVKNALIKGEGFFFIDYINEIQKQMKAGIIPVIAGLFIALLTLLPMFEGFEKYVFWLALFIMTMGICIGVGCAARLLVVRNVFNILAQGQKSKQNYSEYITYGVCGLFVVSIVVYAVFLVG